MGLDIFFYKQRGKAMTEDEVIAKGYKKDDYSNDIHPSYEGLTELTSNEDPLAERTFAELNEIGYFRKVNFLMSVFNPESHNCEYIELSPYDIEMLRDNCIKVLNKRVEEFSENILPTMGGFFYGDTDYDEWYYSDVENVANWAEEVLNDTTDDDVLYFYCWY